MERKTEKLQIIDFEDKTSKDGSKNYTRFKTDQGWMSCFDKDLIADVKKSLKKTLMCEITIDGEKGYKNIQKVEGVVETPENSPEKPSDSKKAESYTKDPVGMAVEIFCVLAQITDKNMGAMLIMDEAIALVKKARGAFAD